MHVKRTLKTKDFAFGAALLLASVSHGSSAQSPEPAAPINGTVLTPQNQETNGALFISLSKAARMPTSASLSCNTPPFSRASPHEVRSLLFATTMLGALRYLSTRRTWAGVC
jgi:hypothetical protein